MSPLWDGALLGLMAGGAVGYILGLLQGREDKS